ncbi:MAG: VOC family protein, partial [Anaerolineae bacterium]|nr:VOC family protein [Anaerolineae bacterium]
LRYDQGDVGGAIVFSPHMQPAKGGVLVYLNTWGDIDGVLSRVEAACGKVITPKRQIGTMGYIAIIEDSEGNQVGLHMPAAE